jgi:signal transduction histidine kinase
VALPFAGVLAVLARDRRARLDQAIQLGIAAETAAADARSAVLEERMRIARDLHDVVAHHVSMIGVQAGAARVVLDRDPGKAKQALSAIESSSREAVGELHRLLDVEIHVEGDQRPLSGTVDVSAYRIVQEALTNTLKHSGASHADVHLRYLPEELELEISDDDDGTGVSTTAGGGFGLVGMRERVSLHGGTLAAGGAPGGGFVVRARLPTGDRSS